MKIFELKENLYNHIKSLKKHKVKIGFVPTMGALHRGHLALVEASLNENSATVVSIFVNPTQFDNSHDLETYPKTFEQDISLLKKLDNEIIVFYPDAKNLYEGKIKSQKFDFDGLEQEMEGKFRKGHFNGVATVVKKLFETIQPDRAYFGEKDFQQLQIIKKLVEKEQMPIKIVQIPIYREEDGLAMSSRNKRLSPKHRAAAAYIYETLKKAKQMFKKKEIAEVKNFVVQRFKEKLLLDLEYFEIADEKTLQPAQKKIRGNKYRAFIVVFAGEIRLIDNIALY